MTPRTTYLALALVLAAACGPVSPPEEPEPHPEAPAITLMGFDAPFTTAGAPGPEGDITGRNGTLRFGVAAEAGGAQPLTVTCTGTSGDGCTCTQEAEAAWACAYGFEVVPTGGEELLPQSVMITAELGETASRTVEWDVDVGVPAVDGVSFDPDRGCTEPGGFPVLGASGAVTFSQSDAAGLASVTCALLDPLLVIDQRDCSAGRYAFASLANGHYGLRVSAVDLVGNEGLVCSLQFLVDAAAPIVTWLAPGPSGVSLPDIVAPDQTPAGTFSIDGDTSAQPVATACELDGHPTACSTQTGYTLEGLAEGRHTVVVTATDCAQNASRASLEFDVDLNGPAVEVEEIESPPGTLAVRIAIADAITNVESVSCALGGSGLAPCPIDGYPTPVRGGSLERVLRFDPAPPGTYTLSIQAHDRWGHASRLASVTVTR